VPARASRRRATGHAGREIPRQRGRDDQTLSVTVDRLELPGVPGLATEVVGRIVAELDGGVRRSSAASVWPLSSLNRRARTAATAFGWRKRRLQPAGGVRRGCRRPAGTRRWSRRGHRRVEALRDRDTGIRSGCGSRRTELDRVLRRLAQDEERQAFRTRQLLDYIRDQASIEPLAGEGDPSARYNRLRQRAARSLHTDATVAGVSTLYTRRSCGSAGSSRR
jgi:hypothetical protein